MKARILLVEDDEAHAELMRRAFEASKLPWAFAIAPSLSRARQLLASEDFDLVIADYRLPDGEGLDLIAARDGPVIVLSSQGSESIAADSIKRGALDYVVKSPDSFAAMPEHATRALRAWALVVEKREAEASLRRSLAEKEVLLKEVHHRVKNNFQIVSSLLALQAAAVGDEGARAALLASENRIRSLALVHERLYEAEDLARIDFADYMKTIASSLDVACRGSERGIRVDVAAESLRFPLDLAIPLGLILNELITNALLHAFPSGRSGGVIASLASRGRDIVLSVTDDGLGLPRGIDPCTAPSLGFELVRVLAAQTGGHIETKSGRGASVAVVLPAEPARRRCEFPFRDGI